MKPINWSIPDIGEKEKQAILKVLESGWISQGPETKEFEKEIAEYCNCKYAIAVNSGTSALICALLSNDIKKNDEVIVPTNTFIASVNAILSIGAKPILVDCDSNTFNTNSIFVKEKISKKTRAIIPVDFAGMPVDIDAFNELAEKNNLILIEDAAEALGAEYKHKRLGSFNHTTIFSFHMAKLCSTIEGGCIVTNDQDIADKARLIRNHGMKKKYEHEIFGLNLRITDLQSAIGRVQLKKLNKYLKWRGKIANLYEEELNGLVEFQKVPEFVTKHPRMVFSILINPNLKLDLKNYLNSFQIDARESWKPAHMQSYHKSLFKGEKFPNSEDIYFKTLNLPIGNGMIFEQVGIVIDKIKEFFKTNN